jgi:hypothetical protein
MGMAEIGTGFAAVVPHGRLGRSPSISAGCFVPGENNTSTNGSSHRRSALTPYESHVSIAALMRATSGDVIHRFTNATPVTDVWQLFEDLKPTQRP